MKSTPQQRGRKSFTTKGTKLSYLRAGDFRLGLLFNFHTLRLRDGIKRIAN